ncbi:MAG: glycosyltransferase [Planctomycetota bacterium]
MSAQPRVAIVHHWMVARRGGERTLEALARLLPGAALFTLVHDPLRCPAPSGLQAPRTTALQWLPGGRRFFRLALPLLPTFYRQLDLAGHGFVLSSDAALAKTVRVPAGARHICYCYSPPRWAHDLRELYLQQSVPALLRPLARALLVRTADVDRRAADQVTEFLAISQHVAARIERCYGRKAEVVYPPVDTEFFRPATPVPGAERPYLLLGEAVPYKRFDLAVEACRRLQRPLIVAGSGQGHAALRRRAGPLTRFVREPDDTQVRALYRGCRALLFPGEEDFGLVPLEAMACGRPVVGLRRGGLGESVLDGHTGVLYDEPSVDALVAALQRFEAMEAQFLTAACVARAAEFSTAHFLERMRAVLARYSPP